MVMVKMHAVGVQGGHGHNLERAWSWSLGNFEPRRMRMASAVLVALENSTVAGAPCKGEVLDT